jgi:hypothetical protein
LGAKGYSWLFFVCCFLFVFFLLNTNSKNKQLLPWPRPTHKQERQQGRPERQEAREANVLKLKIRTTQLFPIACSPERKAGVARGRLATTILFFPFYFAFKVTSKGWFELWHQSS